MKDFENLFEKLEKISFLKRLFFWRSNLKESKKLFIQLLEEKENQTKEARENLIGNLNTYKERSSNIEKYEKEIQEIRNENLELTKKNSAFEQKISVIEKYQKETEESLNNERNKNSELTKKNSAFEQEKENRIEDYNRKLESIQSIKTEMLRTKDNIEKERDEEKERIREEQEKVWKSHEDDVAGYLEQLAIKSGIEYVKDSPTIQGKPDNVLKIADEYIIFDAKAPTRNIEGFDLYLKTQSETLKKYFSSKQVKKEAFLVIPDNTLEKIQKYSHNMVDYRVFIVTKSNLAPIIAILKKMEEYEFLEDISPEDRDNIATIIGKFSHFSKRKIQLDVFVNDYLYSILDEIGYLPKEMKDKIDNARINEKIKMPTDRRKKDINIEELKKNQKINEAKAKSISLNLEVKNSLNKIPLEEGKVDEDSDTIEGEEENNTIDGGESNNTIDTRDGGSDIIDRDNDSNTIEDLGDKE